MQNHPKESQACGFYVLVPLKLLAQLKSLFYSLHLYNLRCSRGTNVFASSPCCDANVFLLNIKQNHKFSFKSSVMSRDKEACNQLEMPRSTQK